MQYDWFTVFEITSIIVTPILMYVMIAPILIIRKMLRKIGLNKTDSVDWDEVDNIFDNFKTQRYKDVGYIISYKQLKTKY